MDSFTLLDPEPVAAASSLFAPVFSTTDVAVAPKKAPNVKRRRIGKRNSLSLLASSPGGHVADDEDEIMSESDGEIGFEDDEDDDENVHSQAMKRSRSVDSARTVDPNKKLKISGGRAATHKAVTFNLDSDDEIILTMKRSGQKDVDVAKRLADEGRTKYEYKSVATRYIRIEKVIEEHEEQRMEDEFSDFHEEEDDALQVAQEELQTSYQRQRDILETKHWREVAKLMKARLNKAKYSKNACRDRAEALANGTAIVPFEQDTDQEARRAQVLEQIETRKAARAIAEEETRHAEEEKQRIKNEQLKVKQEAKAEKDEIKAKKDAEKAEEQAKKDAEKAERERVKEEKLRKEEREKKRKQDLLEQKRRASAQIKLAKEMAKAEEKNAKQKAVAAAKMSKAQASMVNQVAKMQTIRLELMASEIMNASMQEAFAEIVASKSPANTPTATSSTNKKKTSTKVAESPVAKKTATSRGKSPKTKAKKPSTPSSAASKYPSKSKSTATKAKPNTSSSPTTQTNMGEIRDGMNITHLRVLSRNRGLGVSGKKAMLIQNLTKDDNMKSVDALKRILQGRNLACSGSKQELIDRIAKDDVEKAVAEDKKKKDA